MKTTNIKLNMKKGLIMTILVMVSIVSIACTKTPAAKQEGVKKNEPVVQMTKDMFQKNIVDLSNSKRWEFKGDLPVIIDFYADWCGPCRQIAPILKELAKDYEGKIRVYKVNVDKEKELTATFGIQSLPTVVFIPMKGEPQTMVGSADKATYKKNIDAFLLKKK